MKEEMITKKNLVNNKFINLFLINHFQQFVILIKA